MLQRTLRIVELISLCLITSCLIASPTWAQAPGPRPERARRAFRKGGFHRPTRPGLLFKEDWKPLGKKGEHPVTAESNSNPNLELKLYIPAGQILLEGKAGNTQTNPNPPHVWTGLCTSACGLAFRDKTDYVNLTGLARMSFVSKTSGFHHIRPMVKLADGTWYVGSEATGMPGDWLMSEISFAGLHWMKLNIKRMVTVGLPVSKIDLSKVDEVGFVDLTPGSGHGPGGWSDVAQVEVFARGAPRKGQ